MDYFYTTELCCNLKFREYCRFSYVESWDRVIGGTKFEEAIFVYVLKREKEYLLQDL